MRAKRILELLWNMHMSPRTPAEVSHGPALATAINHYGRDYQLSYMAQCLAAMAAKDNASTALATLHSLLTSWTQARCRPCCWCSWKAGSRSQAAVEQASTHHHAGCCQGFARSCLRAGHAASLSEWTGKEAWVTMLGCEGWHM